MTDSNDKCQQAGCGKTLSGHTLETRGNLHGPFCDSTGSKTFRYRAATSVTPREGVEISSDPDRLFAVVADGLERHEMNELAVLLFKHAAKFAQALCGRRMLGTSREIAMQVLAIARRCGEDAKSGGPS